MSVATTINDAISATVNAVAPLSRLKAEPDWLRANVPSAPVGIDRARGIIFGRVLAEKGPFKSAGRGEFDDESLDKIVELANANPAGLKSRFTHPGLSADGLGKFLGRDHNVRRDGDKVRGDLHLDRTALDTPPDGGKPLGVYVMDLAESDPGALGSSLVLKTEKLHRLDSDGNSVKDAKGDELPPLWRPTKLHAIDVVDDGDAVHGSFLGSDALPDHVVRDVSAALDAQFRGCDRATIHARGAAFLDRYLDLKFGDDDMATDTEPTSAAPKPTPAPKPPAPAPQPAPTPAPRPTGPTGELSAEIEAQRAELRRQHEETMAALREQREAARAEARAADAIACLRQAEAMCERGTVTAAALSESAGFVPLGTFLHLLDNADAVARETLNGKECPITLRAAFLKLLPTLRPQTSGERIKAVDGQTTGLSADRRKQLLSYSDAGRGVLAAAKK